MKNIFLLILIISITACNNNPKETSQRFIEPSQYSVMGYRVKDTSYHNFVQQILNNKPTITVKGDSIFNVTEGFEQLFCTGNSFSYKIVNDSLFLSNNQNKFSYKILDLSPNSFSLELDNKYLNHISLIKPKDMRRKVLTEVKIEY